VLTEPEVTMTGSLVNVSGTGMGLLTQFAVPLSAPIRIEIGNQLYLGEVCYTRQDGVAECFCGVRLEHVLGDLGGLATLSKRLQGECEPASPKSESVQVPHPR
jgi:hypothetical protein